MLRSITFFITFFFIVGCGDSQSKTETFKIENFEEHYSDEIKGTLLLPLGFQKITKEKLPYVISEEDSTSVLKRLIDNLENDRRDYILFHKENNLNDVVLIHKSEFVDFSKKDANQYVGLLENNMKSIHGSGNYSRLQKKMSQTERSKYIKVKYKINNQNKSYYQTQYVVTSAATTFGLIEVRSSSNDYEDLIKRINYLVN